MAKDDLDELILELKKDIVRAVDNSVDKAAKKTYKEEVQKMYDEYDPTVDRRRYDNHGFMDDANWDEEVKVSNSGIEYTLVNETETVNNSPYRLDEIIEEGRYNWSRSPGKRPVYQRTMDKLEDSDIVENALYEQLQRSGWEIK